MNGSRVTRMGEFSPIGRFLSLEFFSKLSEVAYIIGYSFLWKKLCINFDKKWVGLHFGRFLKSGHHLVTLNGRNPVLVFLNFVDSSECSF
jgi:hypothetical protein